MTITIYCLDMPGLRLTLLCLAKISASATFAMKFVHTSEVLPTTHRSGLISVILFVTRLIVSAAPYLFVLDEMVPNIQCLILGVLTWYAMFAVAIATPETMNKPLPQTVDDMMTILG